MTEEVLDIDAVEESGSSAELAASEPTPLPEGGRRSDLDILRNEGRVVAIAAAGGVVAGAATVAAVSVARSGARRALRRKPSKRERVAKVVGSRSFLIDVHVLGK